jgi:hypothetical protein
MAEQATDAPRIFGFHAAQTRQLHRAGFEGRFVWSGMRDGALELIGEHAGFLSIPAPEIERIRAGFVQGRPRTYRTILWLRGGGPPLCLHPQPDHHLLYAATIRDLAAAVAAEGDLSRVEGGTSIGDALVAPLLMAVPALGAIAVAVLVVTDAAWWQRLAIPAVPVACMALLSWVALARQLPRRLRTLAELDRRLPPID